LGKLPPRLEIGAGDDLQASDLLMRLERRGHSVQEDLLLLLGDRIGLLVLVRSKGKPHPDRQLEDDVLRRLGADKTLMRIEKIQRAIGPPSGPADAATGGLQSQQRQEHQDKCDAMPHTTLLCGGREERSPCHRRPESVEDWKD